MNTLLPQNVWSYIWHFLRPHKMAVLFFVCTAVLAGCLGPFNSMLIKHLINLLPEVKDGDGSVLVLPAVLIVLNFIVFDNFTWRFISYLNYKYLPLIKNQITLQTYKIVLASSHQFSSDNLSGRISAQINTLADSITTILENISANLIRGFSLVCIALITMYYVNHYFFLTLLIWFLAFSSFSIYMSKRLVQLSDIHAESESTLSGQLVDSISNISNIRNFARSTYELFNLKAPLSNSNNAFRNKEMYMIKLHCVQGALIAIMQGSMLFFLVHLYQKNELTIGDFALILGLSMEVGYMTWFAMHVVDQFNELIGKCKQSISSLIIPSSVQDKENASDLVVTKGQITFDAVKFHYKGTEPLFQNKTVTIEAGQKVGLVGYSGSGKTTFVNLILRLYDITDGRILIDKQDIRDVKQDSLRANIAMIPQDPSLFHRSLMENIRYGKIEATDEEVIEAAKKAHAHDFINNLPQSYESPVGERGVKLSGGQRQRIAIARAVLKNAPILILDEATSQLDSVTEIDIQESLWELMQNKTTIVIAHRLSTLLHMDRILVFDKGKVVEDGKHSELLSKNGLYKTLWDAQIGGFLPDKQLD